MNAVREKVARICNEHNEAGLNLRISPDERILQGERRTNAYQNPNEHTSEEDEQEDADSFEETNDAHVSNFTCLISLRCFEQHDSNSIVQDRFSEDDSVQLRLNFVEVENGKNGDGICR
jgi:hypothetical protein